MTSERRIVNVINCMTRSWLNNGGAGITLRLSLVCHKTMTVTNAIYIFSALTGIW